MESEDIPDSTVNIDVKKERILSHHSNLMELDDDDDIHDERTSTNKGNNTLLISRVFKKSTTTNSSSSTTTSTTTTSSALSTSSQVLKRGGVSTSEIPTIPKLFIGKALDSLNSNSANNSNVISTNIINNTSIPTSTSPNKSAYGSTQSRPSGPVRNFLRPSGSLGQTKIFSTHQSSIGSSTTTTTGTGNIPSSTINTPTSTSGSDANVNVITKKQPELVVGSFRSSTSALSLNSNQMSSSFVTNSNQSTSLKLQIRRKPETIVGNSETSSTSTTTTSATTTTITKRNILVPDEYNSSDSNSSEPSPKYSDINESSPSSCSGGNNIINSFVSSSAEDLSLVHHPPPISIFKMKEKQQQQTSNSSTTTTTSSTGGSVIGQLNSDVRVQIQKHSNGKVVDINIDDNATENPLSINNNNENMEEEEAEDEEIDEEDEVDDENGESDKEGSNSKSININQDRESTNTFVKINNNNTKNKNNTITITIGDQGVISESGEPRLTCPKKKPSDDGGGGEDDTRRTKRKRKPTRPFMPDSIVPRIKIRRRKGEEQTEQIEGTANNNNNNKKKKNSSSNNNNNNNNSSSNIGFSFETVDDKNIENSTPSSTTPSISTKDVSSSDNLQEKTPRPRGRPKGSVNRVKKEIPETPPPPKPEPQSQPTPTPTPGTPRGRGRPRGSTNKNKIDREQTLIIKQKRKSKKSLLDKSSNDKEEDKDGNETHIAATTPTTAGEDLKSEGENQEEVSSPSFISPVSSTSPSQVPTDRNSEIMSSPSSPPKQIRRRGAPRGPRLRGTGRGGGAERTPVTVTPVTDGDKIITGRRILKPRKPRQVKEKKEKKERKERPKKEKPILVPPPVQVFEEETRMSADIKPEISSSNNSNSMSNSSKPETLIPISFSEPPTPTPTPIILNQSIVPLLQDDASNMSSTSTSATGTPKMKKYTKDLVIADRIPITADTLFEYLWPPNDETGEMHMLQEQVSEYLGVKSFKRKYPDLNRRIVDIEERDFLRASKAVSETQCDLGLTALCSSDVLDIMFNDFPDKYEEFSRMLQERKERELVKNKISSASAQPMRDRTAEFYRRCLKSAAKWNAALNRSRREERGCALDLQTLTLHFPKGHMKVLPPEATKVGHYPVSVLPGQYCDSYKTFTPDELKYLPLNTVMYGPIVPQESLPPLESDSEDESSSSSSSSSDSDSDSDDSLTSSKEVDTSTEIPIGPRFTGILPNGVTSIDSGNRSCKSCEGDYTKNKLGQAEALLHCTKCDVPNHPSCLELRPDMLPFIQKYNWQCTDCKNCIMCNDPADEDKMLFCDLCDRGYHIYCVGLRKVPIGRWHCQVCSVCHSCGVQQPSTTDRLAEWHHEFKKGDKNTKHFMHSLCLSCHKLYKKGQFCPTCLKVHLKLDDKSLSECRSCEKWVHKECAKRPLGTIFGLMCEPCSTSHMARTKLPSHIN